LDFQKIKAIARTSIDPFLIWLVAMIVLAYLWSTPGIQEGLFSLREAANIGVSLIFFFYGLRLSPAKLKIGLGNWRLHTTVQLTTFLVFPVLMLSLYGFFGQGEYKTLWLGVFYLAALPSAVSTSVVMVSIAGGNIPGAIFNASISSLAGVFITPIWMGMFLTAQTDAYDLGGIIVKLIFQVLFPVFLGIILNRRWGAFAEKNRKKLRIFDQSIILLIIYTSFSESFARRMFQDYQISNLLLLGLGMIILFFVIYGFVHLVSRLLGFNREDRITALFCGSKKSLVHGTVMSKVLFPDANIVGILLLPLMLYHALQIIFASIIAHSMARKAGLDKTDE
jgi:solute carrier family 10 (sodium/bile acid cotransporter), member 7